MTVKSLPGKFSCWWEIAWHLSAVFSGTFNTFFQRTCSTVYQGHNHIPYCNRPSPISRLFHLLFKRLMMVASVIRHIYSSSAYAFSLSFEICQQFREIHGGPKSKSWSWHVNKSYQMCKKTTKNCRSINCRGHWTVFLSLHNLFWRRFLKSNVLYIALLNGKSNVICRKLSYSVTMLTLSTHLSVLGRALMQLEQASPIYAV